MSEHMAAALLAAYRAWVAGGRPKKGGKDAAEED